jgi:hypothetical protein
VVDDGVSRGPQMPNEWTVRAEVQRASFRARFGGSRERGAPGRAQGTYQLRRRYYLNLQHLMDELRVARRRGADIERDLRGLGSVYVGPRDDRRQLTAAEVIRHVFPRCDISPPHYRDDPKDPGIRDSGATKECPGGCGAAIPKTYGKCADCAARAVAEFKVARSGRRATRGRRGRTA